MMPTLREYSKTDFLTDGDPDLLEKLYPAFARLIDRLEKLGKNATVEQRRDGQKQDSAERKPVVCTKKITSPQGNISVGRRNGDDDKEAASWQSMR